MRVTNDDSMPRAPHLANAQGGKGQIPCEMEISNEHKLEKEREAQWARDPEAAKKKSQAELDLEREAGAQIDDREVSQGKPTDPPPPDAGRGSRPKRFPVEGRKPEGQKRSRHGKAVGANHAEWARADVEPIVEKEAGDLDTTRRRRRGSFSHDPNNF